MLDGLEYLHRNGVVHRDIKSANILLNKTGSVVIGDFGLAMEIYAGSTAHLVGTPHWSKQLNSFVVGSRVS
jgi:serine/threonine protein kinase